MAAFARNSGFRLLAACLALLFLLEPVTLSVAQAASSDATAPAEVILPGPLPPAPQELTEKRTAYSREFALPDGSRKVEVFLDPIHYRDAAGTFQPIDKAVLASKKPGFAYENIKNDLATYFPAEGGAGGPVRVEKGGTSLEMRPLGPAALSPASPLPAAQVLANNITYLDALPGATLTYTVLPGALKEAILLKDASAPATYEFRLEASGLFPQESEDGSIAFVDEQGTPQLLLPRPWAKDSSPGSELVDLTQAIRPDGEGYMLTVSLDPAWLTDPARVFPVLIDPTVETQSVSQDTFISPDYPTSSYSSRSYVRMGTDNSYGDVESLVKFNLPNLTEYPQIQQASISLYKNYPGKEPGTNTISAYRVTSSWTNSVTWNTRPSLAASPDSQTSGDGPGGWYSFDITESVEKWYAGTATNYGTQFKGTHDAHLNSREFRSSEYSDPAYKPKLTIVYLAGDPRHTTYHLGEFAGHSAEVALDKARLELQTTDLAMASWGPRAALDRRYSSTVTTAGTFAPGWRFGFEQRLAFPSGSQTDYTDTTGETHSFFYTGTAWQAPNGFFATLAHPGSSWTLTLKDRRVLTFNSTGKLSSEADRNGNLVSYTWGTNSLVIAAGNGQQIQVSLNASGKITSASYTTADGTRQVSYTTAAPWQVTYFPGGALEHRTIYTYDASSRLTELKAQNFTAAAGDAKETFLYTSGKLTEVRFPDYASTVPLYNSSNSDARATIAYNSQSATITRRGTVRTSSAPTGASGTAVTQAFTWNPTGTMASRTNPKVSGADETWAYAYSAGTNLLLAETSPLSKTRQWTYDNRGNLLTEKDELQHQTTYTYPTSDSDPNRDLPLTVTDPRGAVTSYTYDLQGNPTLVVRDLNQNPTDNQARNTYTYADLPVGSATFHGALAQVRYLITGSTWATTDFNTDAYYANGEPKKTVYRAVALYDSANPPPSPPASPVDLVVTKTYDAYGNLLSETDTSGQVTETNTYDLAGRLLTATGAPFTATVAGQSQQTQLVTNRVYDIWGHETSSYSTSGGQTADQVTTTYDASGRPSQETHYLGAQTQSQVTYRYDGLGKEITRQDTTTSGQPALQAYDPRGNLFASWEAGVASYTDDKATLHILPDDTSAYDAVNRLLRTTQPGETAPTIYTYTEDGQISRETRPDGTYSDYLYDAAGNETSETRSDGGATSAVYDLGGRVTSHTDENNLTTTYTYDCLGQQLTAGTAGSPASTQTFNTLGWLLARLDADGISTTTVYDTAGRTTRETTAGQTTTSTYEAAGHLTREVDPNDKWLELEYDLFGRVSRELHTLPGAPRVGVKDTATTYDALSRPLDVTDNLTQVTHHTTYPLNTPDPTTDTLTVGLTGTDAVQTTLTLAADGLETTRLSTVASSPQLPNILHTVTARDAGQRVTQATIAAGGPSLIASNYLYDQAGRLQRQWGTSGGGSGFTAQAETTDAYTYDATSGRKSADNLNLSSVGTAGPIVASYTYTEDGRLQTATVDGITEQDTFSAAGNLTAFTKGGTLTSLTYDQANRLQTATTGGSTTYFTFDTTKGWRTSQGASPNENDPGRIRFTHTGAGRLATYSNPGTGLSATYAYDALGQRTQKVVTQGAQSTTTSFTYEGLTLLRLSANQTGGVDPTSWQITYLYDEYGKPYAGVYRSPATSTTATVFGVITSDRGDVVALTDAAGSPFAAYRYDAWGNPQGQGNQVTGVWTQSTNLVNAALAAAMASRQPLRYAAYTYDQESALYYLSARYYDPATRQFITKDPAKTDGEESPYQYCGGDPVGRVDPSGMWTKVLIKFPTSRQATSSEKDYWRDYLIRIMKRDAGYAREKLVVNMGKYGIAGGFLETVLWWVDMVRDRGHWDFKRSGSGINSATLRYMQFSYWQNNTKTNYASKEDFGNFHLGYTGAAIGIGRDILRSGSLAYLVYTMGIPQSSGPYWNSTVGSSAFTLFRIIHSDALRFRDEVQNDWPAIEKGIALYKKYGSLNTGNWFSWK